MAFESIAQSGGGFGRGFAQGQQMQDRAAARGLAQQKIESERIKRAESLLKSADESAKKMYEGAVEVAKEAAAAGTPLKSARNRAAMALKDIAATKTSQIALLARSDPELAQKVAGDWNPQAFIEAGLSSFDTTTSSVETREAKGLREAKEAGMLEQSRLAAAGPTLTVSGLDPIGRAAGLRPNQQGRVRVTKGLDGTQTLTTVEVIRPPAVTKNIFTVDQKGEGAFAKELGTGLAKEIATARERGDQAVTDMADLSQMIELLDKGVETNGLQPMITELQSLASGLGIEVGEDFFGNVGDKQTFNQLATKIIIQGFDKFKGNLNTQEVIMAKDSFSNLGKSLEANKQAIASGMASAELARRRGIEATRVTTKKEAAALSEKWKTSRQTKDFIEIRDTVLAGLNATPQEKEEVRAEATPGATTTKPKVAADSVTPMEDEPQVFDSLPEGAVLDEVETERAGVNVYKLPNGQYLKQI